MLLLEGAKHREPGQVASGGRDVLSLVFLFISVAPGGRGERSAVEDEDAGLGRHLAHPA